MSSVRFGGGESDELEGFEIGRSDSSIVTFDHTMDGALAAAKTARNRESAELIERSAMIQEKLKHPHVIEFREFRSGTASRGPTILTEFAGNGSLASHLAAGKGRLLGSNRIARIVVGIVLGMRYLHGCGVVHRDLCPCNIMLDWDWNVRICNFGHSTSPDIPSVPDPNKSPRFPSGEWRYLAPECFEFDSCPKSDVFSFGLILYEMLLNKPAFPNGWTIYKFISEVVCTKFRPSLPDWISPDVRTLLTGCWAHDAADRLSFDEILERLEAMDFKLTRDVNSAKIRTFVAGVKTRASANAARTL
jgi:serine/threonine protein kinase